MKMTKNIIEHFRNETGSSGYNDAKQDFEARSELYSKSTL